MEIHIDGIRQDLQAAAAALGDEQVVDALRRLSDAVEPSLRLRVIDLLSEAALTLNGQLRDGHVEVRLAGRAAGAGRRPECPDHAASPRRTEGRDRDRGVPRRNLRKRLDRPCTRARRGAAHRATVVQPPPGIRPELGRDKGAAMLSFALFGPLDPDPVERRRPRRRRDGRVDVRPSAPARMVRA
jgi:hypothetical protein